MQIEIKRFYKTQFVELAVDNENGTCLLGVPFDHGGAGHTRYYVISKEEFQRGLENEETLLKLERNGIFLGGGRMYWSSFVGDRLIWG